MKKWILISAAAIILGTVSFFAFQEQKQTEITETQTEQQESTTPDGTSSGSTDEITFTGKVLAGTSSPLIEYNKSDYEKAINSGRLVVLFFHANWCPVCKRETANALYPAFNELKEDNVVGFRIHFNDDQETAEHRELAKKYGIAYQYTKVFVRNDKRLLKSPEEWNKSRYLSEIAKYD